MQAYIAVLLFFFMMGGAFGRGDEFNRRLNILDEWIPMNHSEALSYYTAYELCRLANNNALEMKIGNACKFVPGNIGDCQATVHPGALLRHKSTQPWPDGHHLIDLIKSMRSHKSNTIFLVGDSVTRQHFDDALCSLMRVGLNPKYCSNVSPGPPCSEKRISGIPRDQEVIHAIELPNLSDGNGEVFRIVMNHWGDGALRALHDHLAGAWVKGTALVVFNFGLHANSETEMKRLIDAKLHHIKNLSTDGKHVVVFRETSAQHFPTATGLFEHHKYYDFFNNNNKMQSYVSTLGNKAGLTAHTDSDHRVIGPTTNADITFGCQAIASEEALHAQNYRNRMVLSAFADQGIAGLVEVAPFFELTAARHDYHRGVLDDCTHYASGSMLWAPVWNHLYSVFEKRIVLLQV